MDGAQHGCPGFGKNRPDLQLTRLQVLAQLADRRIRRFGLLGQGELLPDRRPIENDRVDRGAIGCQGRRSNQEKHREVRYEAGGIEHQLTPH
jgi:hypothetical protein